MACGKQKFINHIVGSAADSHAKFTHRKLATNMDYDLGFFNEEKGRVEPGPNPFAPGKVLTMGPE